MWENDDHDRDEPSEQEWQRKKQEAERGRSAHRYGNGGAENAGDELECGSCGKKFVAWKARQVRCQECINLIRQGVGLPPRVPETRTCSVCGNAFTAHLHNSKRCAECKAKGLTPGAPVAPPCPMCGGRGWIPTGLAHEEWGHLVTPCSMCSPFEKKKEEA